jgi:hypothetical protein
MKMERKKKETMLKRMMICLSSASFRVLGDFWEQTFPDLRVL